MLLSMLHNILSEGARCSFQMVLVQVLFVLFVTKAGMMSGEIDKCFTVFVLPSLCNDSLKLTV